ncbi:MAG: hypothetical protein AB7V45_09860 [Candidatus Krumholzibacteriia bacterium]
MTAARKNLMILICLVSLLALGACTREITYTQVNESASSCFDCHNDQDTFLMEAQLEWTYSMHAIGANVAYAGGRSGCSNCHSGAGFEAALAGETAVPYATSIRCFSCHAPHTNEDFQLRVTEAQTLADGTVLDIGDGNLCLSCHQARRDVATEIVADDEGNYVIPSSHWGPHHGPQGDLLAGTNGYEFEGYTYRSAAPPAHLANGCISCHFAENSAADLGGHSFNMTNAAGAMNVNGCNLCHTDLTDFNYEGRVAEIDELGEELHALLVAEGTVDEDGHPIQDAVTTLEGKAATWNFLFWEEDRSHGVHNPDYAEDLLRASIAVMSGEK